MAEKNRTYEKILSTTKDIIRQQGIEAVTIRRVARQAQVNCALVNYHFRSKDNLLSIAVNQIVSGINESASLLDDTDYPPKERLRHFLHHYVPAILQYKEAMKYCLVTGHLLVEDANRQANSFSDREALNKLTAVVAELTHQKDPQLLRLLVLQLMCATVLPDIITDQVEAYTLPDIPRQIDLLLDRMF